jgi:hypothetical protein
MNNYIILQHEYKIIHLKKYSFGKNETNSKNKEECRIFNKITESYNFNSELYAWTVKCFY